jgi:hypothetical protein
LKYLDLKAPNRLYWQYRNKPKINALLKIHQDLCQALTMDINVIRNLYLLKENDFLNTYEYPRATLSKKDQNEAIYFNQLGVIGSLLDQKRPNIETETGTDQNGNPIYKLTPMPSDNYVLMLRSKAAMSTSNTTIDNQSDVLKSITGNIAAVKDNMDMTFEVEFSEALSEAQKQMLLNDRYALMPKPLGVRFRGYTVKAQGAMYGRSQHAQTTVMYNTGKF